MGNDLSNSIFVIIEDIIKSKLQTDAFDRKAAKYSGAIDCCKKTFIAEGYRGFYKGFVPCMMRAGPSNAATFAAYEVAMNAFGR